ncbi:hypothetical protein K2173_019380 [Erythroxylum novogranatense]|uniref:Uncharacterized protein n=1 Tax=Erythroxylum novogranatense TaxID=1862640 RepID=A0AAV8UEF8_9ROSI|nr:hypothetical protein K2173_019380 [Erythroxylum novogranatense]
MRNISESSSLLSSKIKFDPGNKFLSFNYGQVSVDERVLYQETIKQLSDLFTVALQERDEARDYLQKSIARTRELQQILNRVLQSISYQTISTGSHIQAAVTDCYPQSSTPVSDITQGTSSSSLNTEVLDSCEFGSIRHIQMGTKAFIDNDDQVLEQLIEGKQLPRKGKLLQAVIDSRPLLETSLDSVPLPKWRNPPPPVLPIQLLPPPKYNAVTTRAHDLLSRSCFRQI